MDWPTMDSTLLRGAQTWLLKTVQTQQHIGAISGVDHTTQHARTKRMLLAL